MDSDRTDGLLGAAVQTSLQQRGAVRSGGAPEQRGGVLRRSHWYRLGLGLPDRQPHIGSHLADRVSHHRLTDYSLADCVSHHLGTHHLAHDHAESLGEQQRLSSLHRVSVHMHPTVRTARPHRRALPCRPGAAVLAPGSGGRESLDHLAVDGGAPTPSFVRW
jgi:hypothetical protein